MIIYKIIISLPKIKFDCIEYTLQNSEVLCGRFSQHDHRKNALGNHQYQTFHYVCHFKSVFLPKFLENKFRK